MRRTTGVIAGEAEQLTELVLAGAMRLFPRVRKEAVGPELTRIRDDIETLLERAQQVQSAHADAAAARQVNVAKAKRERAAQRKKVKKKPADGPRVVWTGQTRKPGSHRGPR